MDELIEDIMEEINVKKERKPRKRAMNEQIKISCLSSMESFQKSKEI
jgi:hypothetical protein